MDIQLFKSDFGAVRVIQDERGEPWFVAKDVADVLGYRKASDMVRNLDEDEAHKMRLTDETGRNQEMVIINESGLYSAILRSNKPEAKKFKKWVTSEVLPSIRKHGGYSLDGKTPSYQIEDPIKRAERWIEEQKEKLALEQKVKRDRPKVEFAESVEVARNSLLIGQFAKAISTDDCKIGQNRLFEWLRNNGYLIKNGARKNMPVQKYLELGYFEVVERTVENPDGSIRVTVTTKITGKGQVALTHLIKRDFCNQRPE